MLRDYFHAAGIRFGQDFAFEPRMLPELRAAMTSPAVAPVTHDRGLRATGHAEERLPGHRRRPPGLARERSRGGWVDGRLGRPGPTPRSTSGGGLALRSIGKLDLPAYASLLREAAIGVSLMISPHPSYPPLEMAHLGMLVLTNRFAGKDLSTWHSNIHTTDDLSAEGLAALLSELVSDVRGRPGHRVRRSVRPARVHLGTRSSPSPPSSPPLREGAP